MEGSFPRDFDLIFLSAVRRRHLFHFYKVPFLVWIIIHGIGANCHQCMDTWLYHFQELKLGNLESILCIYVSPGCKGSDVRKARWSLNLDKIELLLTLGAGCLDVWWYIKYLDITLMLEKHKTTVVRIFFIALADMLAESLSGA